MTIWVIRHGSAGRKRDWPGDDDLRPLDALGYNQAETVASVLVHRTPRRLFASPTRRCVDTLVPLARRLRLEPRPCESLRVGGFPDGLLALLARAVPGDVVSTHGEVLRPALRELRDQGAVTGDHDDDELLAKGCVWELDLTAPKLVLL
jgi:8-oxo-(d)GTP phosphatase